ncbi:MAG: hypothetical protein AB1609_22375, partial [Bacillota bacterium]
SHQTVPLLRRPTTCSVIWRPVWFLLRLWLGYQWLEAGLHKIVDPKWVVTGEAIRGYWMRAAGLLPDSKSLIKYSWYEAFIRWLVQSGQHVWFAKLVAIGELVVGRVLAALAHPDREYMIWQEWKEGYARLVENRLRRLWNLPENHAGGVPPFSRVSFYESGSLYIAYQNAGDVPRDLVALFEGLKH